LDYASAWKAVFLIENIQVIAHPSSSVESAALSSFLIDRMMREDVSLFMTYADDEAHPIRYIDPTFREQLRGIYRVEPPTSAECVRAMTVALEKDENELTNYDFKECAGVVRKAHDRLKHSDDKFLTTNQVRRAVNIAKHEHNLSAGDLYGALEIMTDLDLGSKGNRP
jgi:hypothetical protein